MSDILKNKLNSLLFRLVWAAAVFFVVFNWASIILNTDMELPKAINVAALTEPVPPAAIETDWKADRMRWCVMLKTARTCGPQH